MASRQFFNPMVAVALGATPLVSSTCSMLFAWDQQFFLSMLNRPAARRASSRPLLQPYFTEFFRRGLPFVVGCIGVSFWSGLGNLHFNRTELTTRGSFWWYAAGTALATAHLLFVPAIAPSCQAIMDESDDAADPNEGLDEWLTVNAYRSLTVDLAAWAAFVVAVVKTLRV